MVKKVRCFFKLRNELGLNFYLQDFLFRKILRKNADVTWAIHFTSTIHHPEKIIRGKNVFPGDSPGNYIEASNGIIIGDYTNLGPNVGLLSSNHDLIDNSKTLLASPITIGGFCWIGMNAVILPSVVLGDFTIVGAGAVVTKSFPDGYCVIAGNPAVEIKKIDKTLCDQFRRTKL